MCYNTNTQYSIWRVFLLWWQILENLNIMDMIITAVTVPFTIISSGIFTYRKCKKRLRRRFLKKLLGYDEIVIHIPTRIADNTLGEKRLKPVVAKEDYNTFERLRNILLRNGFQIELSYIPARNDDILAYGELELKRDKANIVVCGPKNSKSVEEIFTKLEGLDFVKGDEGWYFDDLVNEQQFSSPLTEPRNQYAFLGKVPIDGMNILLICGIHAIGSDGVAYLLGDNSRLDSLLRFVKDKNFYCLVKSSYNQEAKEIYDAQLTNCVRVIKGED